MAIDCVMGSPGLARGVIDQRRDTPQRIDAAKCLAVLLAGVDVDVGLLARDALEVARDAHAVGGGRAPEGEQFEAIG